MSLHQLQSQKHWGDGSEMSYRIGIDVGGTMTDAVIIDAKDKLAAKTKVANSEDIVTGIRQAVEYVIRESGISPSDVDFAMLGTTQVTNAIIERKGLNKVLSIRIGAPAATGVKPLASWPSDLARWGQAAVAIVHGGHEFDGRTISRLDEAEVARIVRESIGKVEAVAITSVFSPISASHEERAAEIVRDVMGEIPISMSHQIGSIGLLERENATILNAMVTRVARRVVHTFAEAMKAAGVHAHLYLAQNDGTLMNLDYAQHYPIFTVACGPTNSMRGASFLAGLSDAIVVDIGGTSTDVGILVKGYPRESALAVEVGGVRTNFRMPDLVSVGIGGGSVIRSGTEGIRIGPDSVGYRIVQEGLAFGGSTTTFTDIAVARGRGVVGNPSLVQLSPDFINQSYDLACRSIVDAIARIKTSAEPLPLIAVGGGSFALPDELPEVSNIIRPKHYEVANAIGAAMAQISGRVDRVYSMEGRDRKEVLQEAENTARAEAIAAGAAEDSLSLIDVEELPLSYLPGNATRIRVTVGGTLKQWEEARTKK